MERLGGFANLTAESLVQLTGAAVRTAQRWRREDRAPQWALRVLRILLLGELDAVHPTWSGWSLRDGTLQSPEGAAFTPGQIRAIPVRAQHISALELELRELRCALVDAEAAVRAVDTPTRRAQCRRALRSTESESASPS
jgi:hypothetical protein